MGSRPWQEFAAEFLDLYRPPLRALRTWRSMRRVVEQLGALGVATTADLNPALIARYVAWLHSERGNCANTIVGRLGYVRALCNYAHDCGYVVRTPFGRRRVYVRGEPANHPQHHGWETIRRVLDHLASQADDWRGHRLYALAALAAYTGARRFELLTAGVEDLDLDVGIWSLRPRAGRFKTAASAAPLPLAAELVAILAAWVPRTGSSWLFPGWKRQRPWVGGSSDARATAALRDAAGVLGVTGFTLQSLRHSWATHAESRWGLPEGVIQRVLRHTTKLTQWHYRHADVANLQAIGALIRFT